MYSGVFVSVLTFSEQAEASQLGSTTITNHRFIFFSKDVTVFRGMISHGKEDSIEP
jgi:hypothetical protein